MSKKIKYYDKKLANLLIEKFDNKFGEFQPIIIDILLRRKFVFKYTDEQCLKEADRLLDNCEEIIIKKQLSEDYNRNCVCF